MGHHISQTKHDVPDITEENLSRLCAWTLTASSLENKYNQELEIDKINFLATKVFIEKNKYNISNLQFSNGNLYFENNLLLKDVKEFSITKTSKQITIYINFKG